MLTLIVGPAIENLTAADLHVSVAGRNYWRMRGEYAPGWTHAVGLSDAEAAIQRFMGYPQHLHGAELTVTALTNTKVLVRLAGGIGWELVGGGKTLSSALYALAREAKRAETLEPGRLRRLGRRPKVKQIEARVKANAERT